MKKKILALVLALVMALSLAACGNNSTPAASGSASGSEEPTLSGDLVLYCTMTENDISALQACFKEVYPDINVEVVNGSAGELVTRLQGEAANPVGDLVWGGMADSDGMKNADVFASSPILTAPPLHGTTSATSCPSMATTPRKPGPTSRAS